jgi:site-specific recombinase XerC
MQMSGKAKHELQELINANNWRHGRKNKGVSFSTEDNRATTLWMMFHQLHRNLNMPMMPRSFKSRHVKPLVCLWEQKGLSAATMQTRLSYLRTFSTWIGKAGMISGTLASYLQNPDLARRTYAAQHDKSWPAKGIDVAAKIAEITAYDKYVGAKLVLKCTMGLRAKETAMCRPHESDQGDFFVIKHGTKGGRVRSIPIDTPEKRAAVDLAKSLVEHPSHFLGDPSKTLKQNVARYRNTMTKFHLTKAGLGVTGHGLRAGYGLDMYQKETGEPAPVRGGGNISTETDRAARLKIAEHYGHGRASISTAYLGSVLKSPEQPASPHIDDDAAKTSEVDS